MKTIVDRQSGAAPRSILAMFFILGLVVATNKDVSAQQGKGPCREDAAKLCKDVQPGGGRIIRCLKEHESELSTACKEKISETKEKLQEFQQACRGDSTSYCKDIQPGGGRIIRCLKEHEDQLSAACKGKISQAKTRR